MSKCQEVSPIHVPSSEETALEEFFRNAESNRISQLDSLNSMADGGESEEKERRLAKNREHARSCRARKKAMIQTLRDTVGSLSEANQELKSQNEALQKKVQALEEIIRNHVQQLNVAQAATLNFPSNNNSLNDLLRRQEMISNILKMNGSNQSLPFQPGNFELLASLKREMAQNLDSQTHCSNASSGNDVERPRF